jgi:hypothetical protein
MGMKILTSIGIVLMTIAVATGQAKVDLDALSEKISSQLESKLPDWKHSRVEPFGTPESKVVVQRWYTSSRIVMVAVAVRESDEAAQKELRSFLEFRREPESLTGFGDEAFLPDRNGSSLVLRRGRYVIYTSIVLYIEYDPDYPSLTEQERVNRRKSEGERILKEFAKHLSAIELD